MVATKETVLPFLHGHDLQIAYPPLFSRHKPMQFPIVGYHKKLLATQNGDRTTLTPFVASSFQFVDPLLASLSGQFEGNRVILAYFILRETNLQIKKFLSFKSTLFLFTFICRLLISQQQFHLRTLSKSRNMKLFEQCTKCLPCSIHFFL